jgi:hypothetical protein
LLFLLDLRDVPFMTRQADAHLRAKSEGAVVVAVWLDSMDGKVGPRGELLGNQLLNERYGDVHFDAGMYAYRTLQSECESQTVIDLREVARR